MLGESASSWANTARSRAITSTPSDPARMPASSAPPRSSSISPKYCPRVIVAARTDVPSAEVTITSTLPCVTMKNACGCSPSCTMSAPAAKVRGCTPRVTSTSWRSVSAGKTWVR